MEDRQLIELLESVDPNLPDELRRSLTHFRDSARELILTVPPCRKRSQELAELNNARNEAIIQFATIHLNH